MKSEERRALQQNELEQEYVGHLKPFLEQHGRLVGLIGLAVVLVFVAFSVFRGAARSGEEAGWEQLFEARGGSFDEAQTNQARLEAVAEEYGDSNASVWAHVMAGNSFLGNASRLAFRDGDASKAEYASAKSHFEDALAISDAPLEAHAKALFGLASVQEATSGGELDEAKASFQRLIDEYPDSPLVPAAEARLKALNRPTTGPLLAWLAEQNPQPADFAQPVDGSPDDEPALEGLPIETGPGTPIGDAEVSIDDVFSDLAGPMTTDDDPTGEEPATGESTAEEPSAEEPAESPDKPEMKAGAEDAPPTDPAADPPADPEAGTEEPAEKPAEGEKPSEDQPAAPAGSSSENEPPAGGSAESGSAGDSE